MLPQMMPMSWIFVFILMFFALLLIYNLLSFLNLWAKTSYMSVKKSYLLIIW